MKFYLFCGSSAPTIPMMGVGAPHHDSDNGINCSSALGSMQRRRRMKFCLSGGSSALFSHFLYFLVSWERQNLSNTKEVYHN